MSFYRNRWCSITEEEMKDPEVKKQVDLFCDDIDEKYRSMKNQRADLLKESSGGSFLPKRPKKIGYKGTP